MACTFVVLDSDGNSFTVTDAVLDSDGNSFDVGVAANDSDGNSFTVGTCTSAPAAEAAILGGGGGGVRKVKSKRRKDPYQWVREDLVKAFTALEAEPEPPRVVVEIKREYAEPTSYKPVIDYAALQADVALAQRLIAAYQALIEKRVMDEIIERDDEEVLMLFMSTRRLAVH